ncbi:hypothetical protein DFH29DRAFT_879993 [Suillus ampliporus]|nr:hypothetical protein DFH29DRAFT_879993 [Suillus ampliporus]
MSMLIEQMVTCRVTWPGAPSTHAVPSGSRACSCQKRSHVKRHVNIESTNTDVGEASDIFSILPKLENHLTIKQELLVFKLEDAALKLEDIKKEEDLKEEVIKNEPVTQDEQADEEQNDEVG